jgi:hypothetical protein
VDYFIVTGLIIFANGFMFIRVRKMLGKDAIGFRIPFIYEAWQIIFGLHEASKIIIENNEREARERR